jgi:hypothetical protein
VSSVVDFEPPLSPDDAPYPRFSDAEYGRRRDRVEALRADAGVHALVIYGSGNARHDLQYLTAWPARQEGWLVLGQAGPPALFLSSTTTCPTPARWPSSSGSVGCRTHARPWRAEDSGAMRRAEARGRDPCRACPARRGAAGRQLVDLTADFRQVLVTRPRSPGRRGARSAT